MDGPLLPVWALVALRFLKLLSVMVLAAGTVGAFLPEALADRRRAAYLVAGPGFGLSWAVGFVLLGARGVSPTSTWILGAIALSLFSINVVLWSVGAEGRRGPVAATLALGALAATLALMVWAPA